MLCGERNTLLRFDDNSAGDTIVEFCWRNWWTSLGIGKLRWGRSFCGNWLRITQLYPGGEITFWIKPGKRSYSAGDKFLESTGDQLPAGEMDSTFLGNWIGLSWGSIELYREVTPLNLPWYLDGTIRLLNQLFIAPVSDVGEDTCGGNWQIFW